MTNDAEGLRMTEAEVDLFTLEELLIAADVFGADAAIEGVARVAQAEEVPPYA